MSVNISKIVFFSMVLTIWIGHIEIALATPIVVDFSGTITQLERSTSFTLMEDVTVNTKVWGSIYYDTNTSSALELTNSTIYDKNIYGNFIIGGNYWIMNDSSYVWVSNDIEDGFSFNGTTAYSNTQIFWDDTIISLSDSTGTAFNDLFLPSLLDLANFSSTKFALQGYDFTDAISYEKSFAIYGTLDALSSRTPVSPVPEPSTMILLSIGLVTSILWINKRGINR